MIRRKLVYVDAKDLNYKKDLIKETQNKTIRLNYMTKMFTTMKTMFNNIFSY